MTYVYLGNSVSEVIGTGIRLSRFGQRVELPEPIAEETKRPGGLPMIPADRFDELGFTEAELAGKDAAAAKRVRAQEILYDIRYPSEQAKGKGE